ncbi:MAG: T9SS type A sorting domain-containing protein, partial [Bacteroidales bacterium]|nr:T9SS type A sorting domain-containing protein [Bacteroidales bacterium]
SQAITYYRRPPGQIRPDPYEPYNPTSNVTINRTATANPCTTTFCTPVGGGGHRSDLSDIEQYIAMQSQYDQLLANLGENPEILQQLLVLSDAMRELSDNAISGILHDSVIYVDALKSWYEVVRTPIAKYWLAEVYASESNYEQSEAILRAIPPAFDFSEPELIEHDNYMQFHHFKKQMLLSGRNWTLLDESEIAQLQRIAEATKGRSSGMAKGALCFFFDICYEDEFEAEGQGEEEKEEGKEGEGEKSPSFGGTEGRLYELSIYPNPTPSEMMVSLNNPAVKIVRMEVYDMTSRKVHQQIVNQSFDTLRLNELERGVYILKVYLDQGDMLVRKVVKQ